MERGRGWGSPTTSIIAIITTHFLPQIYADLADLMQGFLWQGFFDKSDFCRGRDDWKAVSCDKIFLFRINSPSSIHGEGVRGWGSCIWFCIALFFSRRGAEQGRICKLPEPSRPLPSSRLPGSCLYLGNLCSSFSRTDEIAGWVRNMLLNFFNIRRSDNTFAFNRLIG